MSDYSELKRLAEECPWEAIESFEYPAAGGKAYCLGSGKTEHLLTTFDRRFQQYIEAARPAVMLALLDKLERAELTALKAGQGEPVAWRDHSVKYAKGEKCPATIETLQAAWDRDQELILGQKAEISRLKETVNQLRQKRAAPPASTDAVSVPRELLKRICGATQQSVVPDLATLQTLYVQRMKATDELRALLAQSESKEVK